MHEERNVIIVSPLKLIIIIGTLVATIAAATAYAFTTFETKVHASEMHQTVRDLDSKLDKLSDRVARMNGILDRINALLIDPTTARRTKRRKQESDYD